MELRKDVVLPLEIEGLALGGQGVARAGDLVVFVAGGLPGELVEARVTRRKPRYAEAKRIGVLRPSPARRVAPCLHFGTVCGGCKLQDYDYPAQVRAKTDQVRETLAHLGGLEAVPVADCVPSPDEFRYRNKMEFSFHPTADGTPLLGLHLLGKYDEVFDLGECHLCSPLTNRIVDLTQRFAREHRWPAYHASRHTGLVRFLVVRHLPTTNQAAVHLIVAAEPVPELEAWAGAVAALDPAVRSVTVGVNASRANVASGSAHRVLRGEETIEERLLGLSFAIGPSSFLQTNSRQAEALYSAALEEAELAGSDQVLDLYCGAGTITLALARQAREVVGVESVEDAIADARTNAERNGMANVRFVAGEARAVLRGWAKAGAERAFRPQVVLVDPPRAGLHERVIDRVAELEPRRVVYVSCNPATLARDLALFRTVGYETKGVRPFDMFPHTPHIECVARLDRVSPTS